MEMLRDKDQKKNSHFLEGPRENHSKKACESNSFMLLNHLSSFRLSKNFSLVSATNMLSVSPIAYNATASLDKLTCNNLVDFDKCQDGFRQFSWSKKYSIYLDVKLKVFQKDVNKDFRPVQNLTKGEANFNQFMRLMNKLLIAAKNFVKLVSNCEILTMSNDIDEQLKLAHKLVEVMYPANRRIFVTLLRYSVVKLESSAQVRFFSREKEDEKFQQKVYAK